MERPNRSPPPASCRKRMELVRFSGSLSTSAFHKIMKCHQRKNALTLMRQMLWAQNMYTHNESEGQFHQHKSSANQSETNVYGWHESKVMEACKLWRQIQSLSDNTQHTTLKILYARLYAYWQDCCPDRQTHNYNVACIRGQPYYHRHPHWLQPDLRPTTNGCLAESMLECAPEITL